MKVSSCLNNIKKKQFFKKLENFSNVVNQSDSVWKKGFELVSNPKTDKPYFDIFKSTSNKEILEPIKVEYDPALSTKINPTSCYEEKKALFEVVHISPAKKRR